MKTTEHNITGTILRAGTGTEGRVTVEIETTREQLRDFPFNMIGKSAIAFIADSAPKPETPIPNDDGWIEHRPGDRRPNFDGRVEVRYQNGETDSDEVYGFHWGKHSGGFLNPEYAIIAWKPA